MPVSAGESLCAVVVMAREPAVGEVKTRLAASLGEAGARAAYVRLLGDTMARVERLADVEPVVALRDAEASSAPEPAAGAALGDAGAFLERLVAAGAPPLAGAGRWRQLAQRGDGLGARLAAVFASLFAAGFRVVVIVNSDSPALPEEYLSQACAILGGEAADGAGAARRSSGSAAGPTSDGAARAGELVLGPAADGGYYLIGTDAGTWRRHGDALAELLASTPMGTPSALDFTERAARVLGLELHTLPLWIDVDEVSDLPLLDRLLPRATAGEKPRGEPLEGLREIYLHVTNRCRLSCPHCYNIANPRGVGELSTHEWRDVIDQCVGLGAGSFVFIGGDPFLRDDLLPLVDHITGLHGRKSRIFFNGRLAAGTAREMARVGRGLLRPLVSLDGTSEVNDSLRGAGNFDDTVASIRHLVAAGLDPVVNTVTLSSVLPTLPEMARLLTAEGVGRLHLIFPHRRGGVAAHPDLVPSGVEMVAALRELVRVAADIGLTVDNVASWRRRLAAPQDFCTCGCRDLAVDPFGKVHACTITCGDPAFVAGDLRRQDLETIWRTSPSLRLLRSAHARDRAECVACPVVDACGGECWMQAHYAARAEARPAGYAAPFPYCDFIRPMFEELIAEHAVADGGQAAAGEADYALFDCI